MNSKPIKWSFYTFTGLFYIFLPIYFFLCNGSEFQVRSYLWSVLGAIYMGPLSYLMTMKAYEKNKEVTLIDFQKILEMDRTQKLIEMGIERET